MLAKWFQKLFRRNRVSTPDAVFTQPNMDEWSVQARQEYIDAAIEHGLDHDEAVTRADTWYIMTVLSKSGDEPFKNVYCPCPNWDYEWAWRKMFDTREEAVQYLKDLEKGD